MDTPGPLGRTVEDAAWAAAGDRGVRPEGPADEPGAGAGLRARPRRQAGARGSQHRDHPRADVRRRDRAPKCGASVVAAARRAGAARRRHGGESRSAWSRWPARVFMALADADGAGDASTRWLRTRARGGLRPGHAAAALTASPIPVRGPAAGRARRARWCCAEDARRCSRAPRSCCCARPRTRPRRPIAARAARAAITSAARGRRALLHAAVPCHAGGPGRAAGDRLLPCGFTRLGACRSACSRSGGASTRPRVLRAARAYEGATDRCDATSAGGRASFSATGRREARLPAPSCAERDFWRNQARPAARRAAERAGGWLSTWKGAWSGSRRPSARGALAGRRGSCVSPVTKTISALDAPAPPGAPPRRRAPAAHARHLHCR